MLSWTRIESWASPGVPDLFGVFKDLDTNKGYTILDQGVKM